VTWRRFFHLNVKIAFNGPRNGSIRNIVIEFNDSILRLPETLVNTVPRYQTWARDNVHFEKDVTDALWFFCKREYSWR